MSLSIRLLLTALVALALVAATALFVGYRSGGMAAQSVLEVATTGDLRALLPSHDAPGSAIADLPCDDWRSSITSRLRRRLRSTANAMH